MGAGWNYGNTLEANSGGTPSETAWGNPEASQEMVDAVKAAGFNTIRVPVSYLDKIDDSNGYKVDEAWLNRVQEVVDYCYKDDMFVIINVHGDGYNSINGGWFLCNGDDQDYIREKYAALWKQIAEKFSGYDEHLIFESMNEEFDGVTYSGQPDPDYYANIMDYNQIFVDTVRASGGNNSHRWLLMPGWNTDIDQTTDPAYGFHLPDDPNNTAGENRMIVSVHCYAPWDYAGQEDYGTWLWGKRGQEIVEINKAPNINLARWGNEDYIVGQFQKLKETFVDKGYPVIVGEFGCIDKTPANSGIPNQIAENRVYYDGYIAGTAAKNGCIPVYWDNGYNGTYGFGLFDRTDCSQTQPEIISTIVKAVADKDPDAGHEVRVKKEVVKNDSVHAYIGLQTKVYTFRNTYNDAQYGGATEWFNTLVKWEGDDATDAGAVFSDADITADGTYTVSVSGYDFSADSDGLNMLFVSTDFQYAPAMKISDVVLKVDDTEIPIDDPLVMADSSNNLYIELVNIYNTDLAPLDFAMPTDSFSVTFTISGTSSVLG
ncbi:MAG: glycoside hydrolase family 5 protein [Ruminococcus sp.]|nr:glycoside hydrolase family 5 protein [Ruminococcus sp.]